MTIRQKKKPTQDSGGMKQFKKGANRGKKRRSVPPIQCMEQNVQRYIVGQDEAVRKIITAIYRAIYLKSIKTNILVIGKSGTGKTETLKQIAKRLRIPYTIEDATKYTKEGYYGGDVEDMLENLQQFCKAFGVEELYEKANIQKPDHSQHQNKNLNVNEEGDDDYQELSSHEIAKIRVEVMGAYMSYSGPKPVVYFKYDASQVPLMNQIYKIIKNNPGKAEVMAVKDDGLYSTGESMDPKAY